MPVADQEPDNDGIVLQRHGNGRIRMLETLNHVEKKKGQPQYSMLPGFVAAYVGDADSSFASRQYTLPSPDVSELEVHVEPLVLKSKSKGVWPNSKKAFQGVLRLHLSPRAGAAAATGGEWNICVDNFSSLGLQGSVLKSPVRMNIITNVSSPLKIPVSSNKDFEEGLETWPPSLLKVKIWRCKDQATKHEIHVPLVWAWQLKHESAKPVPDTAEYKFPTTLQACDLGKHNLGDGWSWADLPGDLAVLCQLPERTMGEEGKALQYRAYVERPVKQQGSSASPFGSCASSPAVTTSRASSPAMRASRTSSPAVTANAASPTAQARQPVHVQSEEQPQAAEPAEAGF